MALRCETLAVQSFLAAAAFLPSQQRRHDPTAASLYCQHVALSIRPHLSFTWPQESISKNFRTTVMFPFFTFSSFFSFFLSPLHRAEPLRAWRPLLWFKTIGRRWPELPWLSLHRCRREAPRVPTTSYPQRREYPREKSPPLISLSVMEACRECCGAYHSGVDPINRFPTRITSETS